VESIVAALRRLGEDAGGAGMVRRAAVIREALEWPSLMHYGEILDTLNEKEVPSMDTTDAKDDERVWCKLVEIFAFGTLAEYRAEASMLGPLSAAQETKLKRLTACSLCGGETRTMSYGDLMRELDIASEHDLEEFIVDECVATGIIQGRLDRKNRLFVANGAMDRDVPTTALESLENELNRWHAIVDTMVSNIASKVERITSAKVTSAAREEEVKNAVDEIKRQLKAEVDTLMTRTDRQIDAELDTDEDGPSSIGAKRRR
jgi:COP9 signalosome complex subunit 7